MSRRRAAGAPHRRRATQWLGARLSERERGFVEHYLGQAAGNGTKAALLAGYARAGARVQAVRLLTKANIQNAIKARVEREERKGIADADERDRLLTEILRDVCRPWDERIRAIVELNKCTGRHSTRQHHQGKLTLEQALGASREVPNDPEENSGWFPDPARRSRTTGSQQVV